jgi:hypothetical protein
MAGLLPSILGIQLSLHFIKDEKLPRFRHQHQSDGEPVLYYEYMILIAISLEGAGDDKSITAPNYALSSPVGSSLALALVRTLSSLEPHHSRRSR